MNILCDNKITNHATEHNIFLYTNLSMSSITIKAASIIAEIFQPRTIYVITK